MKYGAGSVFASAGFGAGQFFLHRGEQRLGIRRGGAGGVGREGQREDGWKKNSVQRAIAICHQDSRLAAAPEISIDAST